MLSEKMTNQLNEQLNLEFYSSNLYLQMSAWCSQKGFEGAAQFLLVHADEEMDHMRKLFTYLNDTGSLALIGNIDAPSHEFASLKDVFQQTFEHEKLITSKINQLVTVAFDEKDFSSFNFLQWYVAEQHEEEKLFGGILDKFSLLDDTSGADYYLDRDLSKLASSTPEIALRLTRQV